MDLPGPDDFLGDAGELEWARLRAQLELSRGFWLGFVFSPSPRAVIVLRLRAARLLQAEARTLVPVRPETPAALRGALPFLLEAPAPERAGCTWVEAVRADSPGAAERPWTRASDELFLRTNERRDALRARLPGGLVFAAPPHVKPRVREAAPDLWAVRSIVIELPAVATVEAPRPPLAPGPSEEDAEPVADPDFALQEAARRAARGAQGSRAQALLAAVPGLLAGERLHEAREAAATARELLRGEGGAAEAGALALLAAAEEAAGDRAASAHVEQAIALRRRFDEAQIPLPWFDRAVRLALARGDLPGAQRWSEEAESLVRARARRGGEAPAALRDLADALDRVAEMKRRSGDLPAATAACEESLALRRRLADLRRDLPDASRSLAVALDHAGTLRHAGGDLATAAAAFEESLAICRRRREAHGDTPETLSDLSLLLDKIGDVRRQSGDLASAATLHEESRALCLHAQR